MYIAILVMVANCLCTLHVHLPYQSPRPSGWFVPSSEAVGQCSDWTELTWASPSLPQGSLGPAARPGCGKGEQGQRDREQQACNGGRGKEGRGMILILEVVIRRSMKNGYAEIVYNTWYCALSGACSMYHYYIYLGASSTSLGALAGVVWVLCSLTKIFFILSLNLQVIKQNELTYYQLFCTACIWLFY